MLNHEIEKIRKIVIISQKKLEPTRINLPNSRIRFWDRDNPKAKEKWRKSQNLFLKKKNKTNVELWYKTKISKNNDDNPCCLIKLVPQAIWTEVPDMKKPQRSILNKLDIKRWNKKINTQKELIIKRKKRCELPRLTRQTHRLNHEIMITL
jgi:hypothetical protein